ncbi:MAG TPA: ATP-binding protein [Rhabdochlamydiaceae bacterium]|jgi:two-component system phosphate regulon sensor histidine kinase PhoR
MKAQPNSVFKKYILFFFLVVPLLLLLFFIVLKEQQGAFLIFCGLGLLFFAVCLALIIHFARHRLWQERNEKEAILEALGEGVLSFDKEMRICHVNYFGSHMIGLSKKQLIGKSIFDLGLQAHCPHLIKKCCVLLEMCQEKMTILTDSVYVAEGKKMYLDLIAAPKPQHKGAILVLQDKSSHHKVLEMGKDFVANASHELRTPITIIRGFAETLHDLPELPREMVSDITEKIVRNCQRMDNLVKNLLTLADLENIPESRFQECDLVPMIENCKQVVLSVFEDAQISIEKSQESMTIDADPDILELALINLLDNSAKYSSPPAQIAIKIDEYRDGVHISIADKGIGIPPEDIEHVFERFYTVNKAHSRRLGGAGLGLSIVKTIVEKHQGTISLSSVLRQGSTFTMILPTRREKTL